MKTQTFTTLLALASGAAATFKDSAPYSCPSNHQDECTPQQSGGYDWGDLPTGPFSGYGGFDFSGFSCQNSFGSGSKGRSLAARTSGFQSKCITGHASQDVSSCPKISCGSGGPSSFTIDHVQVSVEYDCELEFHYGMTDGSTCKEKSQCSTGGTTVKNTQCGGAKNVTVVLPSPPASKPSCSVGIHSVGFNCPTKSASTKPPAATSTPCYGYKCGSSSTSSAPETTSTPCYGHKCGSSSTSSAPETASTPCYGHKCGSSSTSSAPETASTPCYGYKCGSSSTSSAPETASTPCYGHKCGSSSTSSAPETASTPCYGYKCGSSSTSSAPETASTPCYGHKCGSSSTSSAPETASTPCYGHKCGSSSVSSSPQSSATPCYGYNCGSSSASSAPESSPTAPAETTPVYGGSSSAPSGGVSTTTTPSSPVYGNSTSPAGSQTIPVGTGSIPAGTTTTPAGATTAPAGTTTTPAGTTSAPAVTSSAGPVTTPESYTTVIIDTTITTCPVTSVETSSGVTSTHVYTTVSTVYNTKTSVVVKPTAPASPISAAPCPSVLPSCLNTFLPSECKSNTDKDCYCPNADFTKLVFDCLYAHSADNDEIYAAQTFFQGICAQYVPQNPAIITSPPVTSTGSISGPQTTITYATTITLGASSSVYSAVATIPQVAFTTVSNSDVGLVTGTPAPASAVPTTFAYTAPVGTGGAVGTGNAAGTGSPVAPSAPQFTGAASRSAAGLSVVGAAAVFAFFAL